MDELIELWLPNLDESATSDVQVLFNTWGRGGAVIEVTVDLVSSQRSTVKTYLRPEDRDALRQIEVGLAILNRVRQSAGQDALPRMERRRLTDADWAETWKAGYFVLHLGRRLVVKPSWREYEAKPDEVVIELDPGMAFGSGLHATTQLCLLALEEVVQPGQRVLDVGTGSGILAIAAAKLGAQAVLAIDNDPMAVRVSQQNIEDNGVQHIASAAEGTLDPRPVDGPDGVAGQWDVIVANILAQPLIEMAPGFYANLASGGTLVVSGINRVQMEEVGAAVERTGLTAAGSSLQGDWAALFFVK